MSEYEYKYKYGPRRNRWKGWAMGLAGGMAGVWVMNQFTKSATPVAQRIHDEDFAASPQSVSLVGRQHHDGETATAAVGRILYTKLTGNEPRSEELKQALSQLVHWVYGAELGGCYGFFRPAEGSFVQKGMVLGAVLWAVGDEGMVPLLGLSDAPQSQAPSTHVTSLGAHLAYGIATAGVTGLLTTVFGED